MNDDIEGIGTAIAGALAARAVEPAHGEGGGEERLCANCSTELIGTHCHYCGQQAHVHRTLTAIGHDLVHGVLHLDGKFWRTLPMLVWRPGELTRRYAHGERAKFVSPLGMFLFSVFLMFAVLSIAGVSLTNLDVDVSGAGEQGYERADALIEQRLTEARAERAALAEAVAADPALATQPAPGADQSRRARIAALDERIEELASGRRSMESVRQFTFIGNSDGSPVRTGWSRLDHGIEKLSENPGLALYKLQANGYKFSWLLIPISVPFVWLLFFWTRRYRMYDHTVFVTYSLAFMSLFAVALTLAGFAGLAPAWIISSAIAVPIVHMFRQLKQAYRLHWLSAALRTWLLSFACLITSTIFFVLLLGIGALG